MLNLFAAIIFVVQSFAATGDVAHNLKGLPIPAVGHSVVYGWTGNYSVQLMDRGSPLYRFVGWKVNGQWSSITDRTVFIGAPTFDQRWTPVYCRLNTMGDC